ncbi:hypothetical protein ACFQS7_20435 [Dankookia sp. GCM10030260]|uniref:hypothetical protein n=1 Tax=Dankookia sp. GCM10030260 TaxID=3273390 RepID=UPI00361D00D0
MTGRWLAVLGLAASLGLGAGLKLGRAAPDPAALDAVAWFAARGRAAVAERGLGQSGSYRMVTLAGACGARVVPLDKPEEILPLLRRGLDDADWAGAELWLGGLEPWPADPAALPLRQVWYRLRHGVAPVPALLLRGAGC